MAGQKKRYSREEWMQTALDTLSEKGGAAVRIDALAERLHVTKGSFYHHFAGRSDFIAALGGFWAAKFTDLVVTQIGRPDGDGRERLFKLMQLVWAEELDRYDIAFRSWAAQDAEIAKIVDAVDAERYFYIRSLFDDMGFSGAELETRVRSWLVFASAHKSLHLPSIKGVKKPTLEDYYTFFVSSGETQK